MLADCVLQHMWFACQPLDSDCRILPLQLSRSLEEQARHCNPLQPYLVPVSPLSCLGWVRRSLVPLPATPWVRQQQQLPCVPLLQYWASCAPRWGCVACHLSPCGYCLHYCCCWSLVLCSSQVPQGCQHSCCCYRALPCVCCCGRHRHQRLGSYCCCCRCRCLCLLWQGCVAVTCCCALLRLARMALQSRRHVK